MKRAGEYVSNLSVEAAYKSFRPSLLPPKIEIDAEIRTTNGAFTYMIAM